MLRLKDQYKNIEIHFGDPLGIILNTNEIGNYDLFYKWYPFLFDRCSCWGKCKCNDKIETKEE